MVLERAVIDLLEDLQRISDDHEEATDTDVREAIHLVINMYFVWGHKRERFPRSFGMFSREGDLLIADAIWRFLDAAEKSDELASIPNGQARLDVLQAASAMTTDGRRYDEFIGHRGTPLRPALPEHMFADASYENGDGKW
jgi:hypothetical protein